MKRPSKATTAFAQRKHDKMTKVYIAPTSPPGLGTMFRVYWTQKPFRDWVPKTRHRRTKPLTDGQLVNVDQLFPNQSPTR